jgi:hypothetical protein
MRTLLRTLAAVTLLCALASHSFAAATITIINLDGPGEGFNDPTAAAPVGGNPGTTIGQQRLLCFQRAASIWGATLTSTVPIQIQAAFNPLTCTATSAVLGSAGPRFVEFGAPGLEFNNYWYHEALACKEAGVDLTPLGDPGLPPGDNGSDINAQFNSNLGNTGCLTGSGWYYGFDHNEGALIDLLAVLLHEFGHGLGFSTTTSGTSGAYLNGPPALPALWDKYLYDETTGLHWDQNTPAQRVASAISNGNLTWDGPSVTTTAGTFLAHSPELVVPYAPGTVQVNTAAFGAPLTLAGVTAQAVVVADPLAPTGDGCETPFTNAAALAGNIAVIDRGVCTFVIKAKNAQNAGAIGVIIVNNVAGALAPGGADPTITIPTVGITQADGIALKAAIAGGPTTVTLRLDPTLLAGAHPSGRVRMYSPNPFQGGSSVSHWDVSATPNLLMEPAINADLTDNLDLTVDNFRDIGWFGRGGPVATQLALVAADVVNGHPHLEWFSADGANESMRLYRAALPAGFERLGDLFANGTGMVSYDDMDALRGRSYEYQLGLQTSSGERLLGLAHVDVPLNAQLAIKRLAGSTGALAFSVVLAADQPATLDLMDAAGRRIARQDLAGLGAGEHTVSLAGTPHSGVYWARVSQAGRMASTSFVLLQ